MPKTAAARTRPATTAQSKGPAPSKAPDLDACAQRWEQGRDVEALREAGRRYGGDIEAEMAAIAAGTHPLQERARRAQR